MTNLIAIASRFTPLARIRAPRLATAALAAAVLASAAATTHAGFIDLGASETFAVLAGTTVTSTGFSVINGDVGVSPGTAITGFGPGVVANGAIHANDGLAAQAHADAAIAYGTLAALASPPANNLTGTNLAGLTLTPGVYRFNTDAALSGTLTLDGLGQSNPLFVFQIGTTLITSSLAAVIPIAGANADNIYFQVGTAATFGTATAFTGNVLTAAGAALTTGTSINGRVFSIDGAVTLDTNAVTLPPTVPEPAAALLATPLLLGLISRPRRTR